MNSQTLFRTTIHLSLAAFLTLSASAADDPFKAGVRPTDKLSPAAQEKTFTVPAGFKIQLFAAENDIAKPMNLAFDERGRVWATVTKEYPTAAPLDKPGRDSIKVLEDTTGDGRADKITTFVDGLNIPIGIYPYQGGCIAWSIPYLWHFKDNDGDGKCDERVKLYGPLDHTRDTHGMNSSFTRGFDGWLYITHGFRNQSKFKGADGNEVELNSGNTYRIQLDGSRVEHFTHGQVNPFGMCIDPWGNLYTADCHSSPVYQLIRNGQYPGFGRAHDGLGFTPLVIQHTHDSTAISGIVYVDNDSWPKEFQNNVLIGNVMTSRVNRDRIDFHGASPKGTELPDLVKTTDPWFRPVNLQMGPDEKLYIADFYNKIIGHYEVPLDHPGRDRESGRIWSLTYLGNPHLTEERTLPALDDTGGWFRDLNHANLSRRMLATHHLADSGDEAAASKAREIVLSADASEHASAHALWILHRRDGLDSTAMNRAASHDSPLVRNHLARVLSETPYWSSREHSLAMGLLADSDPHVVKAAADAAGQRGDLAEFHRLIQAREDLADDDVHTRYSSRLALRDLLARGDNLATLRKRNLTESDARAAADIMIGIPNADAGEFLLDHVQRHEETGGALIKQIQHAARHAPHDRDEELIQFARNRFPGNIDLRLDLYRSILGGATQRGSDISPAGKQWGGELSRELFASIDDDSRTWQPFPIEGLKSADIPWFTQRRKSNDGDTNSIFLCSLPPRGERLTGILRSKTFSAPAKLSFFLAGHDGFPDKPAKKKNAVRLRDAKTRAVLAEAYAPRHDTARKVTWDLSKTAATNAQVFLEITDADNASSFAWIAAGRFDPPIVRMPKLAPKTVVSRLKIAANLTGALRLEDLQPTVSNLLADDGIAPEVRAEAANALLALKPDPTLKALAALIGDNAISPALRSRIGAAMTDRDADKTARILADALTLAPGPVQLRLAGTLAGSQAGARQLLDLIGGGKASPQLLLDRALAARLKAVDKASEQRITKLSAGLQPLDKKLEALIAAASKAYAPGKAWLPSGENLFKQNCAACHSLGGEGGKVGPQLDGIGGRGSHRILEDLLDPNRNLDPAFHAENIDLKDDTVITGLPLREEGQLLIVVDTTGKEIQIRKSDIVSRQKSALSLMPGNFGDVLKPEQINHLVAYLMSK